jgi:hypothetical protein
MLPAFTENSKILSPFIKFLNFVQASTLKTSRNLKVKLFYYFYTITVLLVLSWFMVSNKWNFLQTSSIPLTFYAQTIDRLAAVTWPIFIISFGFFSDSKLNGIQRNFDEIDRFFWCKFKTLIDYRKLKLFSVLSIVFLALLPSTVLFRIFISESFVNFHLTFLYIFENFFLYFHQAFYLLIVLSVFHRVQKLEKFIEEIPEVNIEMQKLNLEEILFKLVKLVDSINEIFGKIVVLIFGEF